MHCLIINSYMKNPSFHHEFCDQSDLAILKLQACRVKVHVHELIHLQDLYILSTVSMKIYVNTLEQIKCLLIHWILFSIIFFFFQLNIFQNNILCSPVYLLIKSSYDNQYSSIIISYRSASMISFIWSSTDSESVVCRIIYR